MPIVKLENAGTLSKEQKAELIQQITMVVAEVTHKPKDAVMVIIQEISRDNVGRGGVQLSSNS